MTSAAPARSQVSPEDFAEILRATREFVRSRVMPRENEIMATDALPADLQNDLIEFLKSLQVLQPGSQSIVIDEHGNPKRWPPSGDASQNER